MSYYILLMFWGWENNLVYLIKINEEQNNIKNYDFHDESRMQYIHNEIRKRSEKNIPQNRPSESTIW